MPGSRNAKRRVALLMGTSPTYVRELAQGVARHNAEHGRWVIHFERCDPDAPPPAWLKTWKGDGILVRVGNRRMARAVRDRGLPVVAFRWAIPTPGVPAIGTDQRAVAALAAEHLRQRGFRQFAAVGLARGVQPPLDERLDEFVADVRRAGLACATFTVAGDRSAPQQQQRLVRWLRTLPQPLGILAVNDDTGLRVLNACAQARLMVPEQVAVLGAGNDDCLCNLAHPPLSSVDLSPRAIGYAAAQWLDRLMDGQPIRERELLMPPAGIVARRSTDVLATDDQAVVRAAAFIRDHACEGIHIADVLRHVKLSRWALEPRVKRVLGRTVYQEILRVQIECVKELLRATDLPIKQIAARSGFHYVQYLTRAFHRATGVTPGRFRKQA